MNLYQKCVVEMLKMIVHGVYYLVWHTARAEDDKQTVDDAEAIGKCAEDIYNNLKKAYRGADLGR